MKILETLVVFLLLVFFVAGIYLLWNEFPVQDKQFEEYAPNVSSSPVLSESGQFYKNMRFPDRKISYSIEKACSDSKEGEIRNALLILSDKTIIEFYESSEGEITFLCSEIAPEPENRGHFVAGEGGPTEIINTTRYAVIRKAKVSLFRDNRCDEPLVALHEILHAMGFDHNENIKSVMYPISYCNQNFDESIIESINSLYVSESLPDLEIERVVANSSGRYLNFEIVVGNNGLAIAKKAKLKISEDGREIDTFELQNMDIGVKKKLAVSNLNVGYGVKNVSFFVTSESMFELDDKNNFAQLNVK